MVGECEHVHKWKIDWDCQRNEYCYCVDETCDELLCPDDAEAILNEHAALKRKLQMRPVSLARRFHNLYEEMAPLYGYETREETRVFDVGTPNGKLMIAVCARILDALLTE